MTLAAGARLGPFEVLEPLGAGGMGEVYRARDTRLGRDVALKVLPEGFAREPDRRARFEREAQAVAKLAHPHICVVHDIGTEAGIDYIVMELLDGETLASRLERGRLSIDEALAIAVQIASALDAAHGRGVIHRDLKPANIMLTRSGVKIVDFGLAKLAEDRGAPALSVAETKGELTAEGTIVGTVQYMAPEQLERGVADGRTDIFALGAILHEMLTGEKAFPGSSSLSIISAILKDAPKPLRLLHPAAPPLLEWLIATCLQKNPDERWQTARDLTRELRWIAANPVTQPSRPDAVSPPSRRIATATVLVLIAAVAAVLGAVGARFMTDTSDESRQVLRAMVPLDRSRLIHELNPLTLSPDGAYLLYAAAEPSAATSHLFLYSFKTGATRALPETNGAISGFFAPDGERIAFFAGTQLFTMSLSGAPPKPLCEATLGVGGSWADDDTIYFAPSVSSGLWKVSAGGGPCEPVTTLASATEQSHRWPQALPGGRAVLYTLRKTGGQDVLKVLKLPEGSSAEVVPDGTSGRYVPSGHIVYARAGTLLSVPFDLAALKTTGPPVAHPEFPLRGFDGAQFDISAHGDLVYLKSDSERRRLVWVDRSGRISPAASRWEAYENPRISLDERYVAVYLGDRRQGATYDFSSGVLQELRAQTAFPIWTPTGRVAFFDSSASALSQQRAFQNERPETVVADVQALPGSITRDGRWLVYHGVDPQTRDINIWKVLLKPGAKPELLVGTKDRDIGPQLSANGDLLAYVRQADRTHVYVTRFPDGGDGIRVSVDGGSEPMWSRAGLELFYRWNNRLMSVKVHAAGTLEADPPTELFAFAGVFNEGIAGQTGYDVNREGNFLMVETTGSQEVHFARNFVAELKARLAGR
jgi:serine/threonine-protein kinase